MAVFSATHSISAEQTATPNVSRKGFPQTPASKRTHRRRLRRARSSKRVYRHLVWQREEPVRAQGVASKLADLEMRIAALKFQLRVRETKAAAAPRPPQKIKVEQKEEISTPPVKISCLMDENIPVDLGEAFPTVFVLRAMGLPIVSLCKCGHHAPPVIAETTAETNVAEQTAETNHPADTHKTSAKGKLPGLPPTDRDVQLWRDLNAALDWAIAAQKGIPEYPGRLNEVTNTFGLPLILWRKKFLLDHRSK